MNIQGHTGRTACAALASTAPGSGLPFSPEREGHGDGNRWVSAKRYCAQYPHKTHMCRDNSSGPTAHDPSYRLRDW